MAQRQSSIGLKGHLLCAVPQLMDPNFARSIVLLLDHSHEGAMGLVLNHLVPASVANVAESLELEWCGNKDACVRLGGPVDPIRGWILHDQPSWDPAAQEVVPGLMMTTSLDEVHRSGTIAFGANPANFLFILGYAGWSAKQLESEIATGSWVLVPIREMTGEENGVSTQWLFETQPDEMWALALSSIGVDPARLVGMHESGAILH